MSVQGGEIKNLGQKKVTYITHKVVMNITFLIVEDVVNPIIGLDDLHQMEFCFACLRVEMRIFSSMVKEQSLTTSGIQGFIKGSRLEWENSEYTIFDSQSTTQLIAEIDFEVNSESGLRVSTEEEDVSFQEAQPA